jgi:hypothetical protein
MKYDKVEVTAIIRDQCASLRRQHPIARVIALNDLLDKIDAAATAIDTAGLAEQYDELIGQAATKWA